MNSNDGNRVYLNASDREPWPKEIAELIVNDALVYAVYNASRMNGWDRTTFLEQCVVALATARRELIQKKMDQLNDVPPSLTIGGTRYELVKP